jgi:hypothetical protein
MRWLGVRRFRGSAFRVQGCGLRGAGWGDGQIAERRASGKRLTAYGIDGGCLRQKVGGKRKKEYSRLNKERFSAAIISFSIIIMLLSGCSLSNYGQLKSNKEVTEAFENYQILPNLKYYYRGTYSRPIAIVGIKENYELSSNLWVKIDPNSKDFQALIEKVSLQGSGGIVNPWGFIILDHSGRDVGVWYSAIRAAAVEVKPNGQIVNLSPIPTATKGDQRR